MAYTVDSLSIRKNGWSAQVSFKNISNKTIRVGSEFGVAFYGAIISAIAIISLFFGQRMARDYAGAAVLVPYFLITLVAIYLLG